MDGHLFRWAESTMILESHELYDGGRYGYAHDRNSNRLYRENTVTSAKDELYAYDRLDRLTTLHRGDLDGDKDEIPVADRVDGEAWTLSPVGNWDDYQVDDNGDGDYTDATDLDQDRTHNLVNEITGITEDAGQTAWADPAWSARGNMTTVPKPADLTGTMTATYDAWNRLVEVKVTVGESTVTIQKNEYDGLDRRIAKLIPNGENWDRTDYYYSSSWQALEERYAADQEDEDTPATDVKVQYVWSDRYIDSPVLRDRDADADSETGDLGKTGSGLEERVYYQTDANFNVTALVGDVEGSWVVVERYVYTPYGKPTIYNSDWSATVTWANSKANEILYCGYRYDPETGLYHVRNRMYHPALGRWMQPDPLGYVDGMSLYEYVGSNTTAWLDPYGHRRPKRRIRGRGLGDSPKKIAMSEMAHLAELLSARCEKCVDASHVAACQAIAKRVSRALKNTVDVNYGKGDSWGWDPRGGYLCYEWAIAFDRAILMTTECIIVPVLKGGYLTKEHDEYLAGDRDLDDVSLHTYVEIRVGADRDECKVAVDDGWIAADSSKWVHEYPLTRFNQTHKTGPKDMTDPDTILGVVDPETFAPYAHDMSEPRIVPVSGGVPARRGKIRAMKLVKTKGSDYYELEQE